MIVVDEISLARATYRCGKVEVICEASQHRNGGLYRDLNTDRRLRAQLKSTRPDEQLRQLT